MIKCKTYEIDDNIVLENGTFVYIEIESLSLRKSYRFFRGILEIYSHWIDENGLVRYVLSDYSNDWIKNCAKSFNVDVKEIEILMDLKVGFTINSFLAIPSDVDMESVNRNDMNDLHEQYCQLIRKGENK